MNKHQINIEKTSKNKDRVIIIVVNKLGWDKGFAALQTGFMALVR